MTFQKGNIPWSKGLTKETDERVRRLSDKLKGHIVSDKCKEKMRKAKSGDIFRGSNNPFYGKKHSSKTKKKISSMENLISLCRNCHAQTNFNRQGWTNYLQNKIRRLG